ncbi:hypothetical protein QQS21_000910 [Conoideocrella luteorostrata]|uniref:NB-ARC domain-containing protein n=1 Tax=Conoideocrella luteorostrata TaxID=1105319 RepID=A0AAJ0CXW2_9HYPO|nr:hypothetical protein QQS21_000910 [Conoideocrella luteorostrata]
MSLLELASNLLADSLAFILDRRLTDRQRERPVGNPANSTSPQPPPPDEPSPTFALRFRDLPMGIDTPTFLKALADTGDEASRRAPACASDPVSLTQSAVSRSSVATACFTQLPLRIQSQINGSGKDIDGTIRCRFGSGTQDVRFDSNFYGLTPLYWPEDWHVDIIAVNGWNGNAFWSWKSKKSRQIWLRDWLGEDLAENDCRARIFTYGYPSKVANSDSDATLSDYGKQFLLSLAAARKAELEVGKTRPLVFIGQSLGGLVIKQAMKDAFNSTDDSEQDLYNSCICIVMFGVPNLGLDNKAILTMTKGKTNDKFSRDLGYGSQYLRELDENFSVAFRERPIKIIAVYETEDSPSVEDRDGQWSKTGPKIRLVSLESACSLGLGVDTERLPSFTNHSDLSKFDSRDFDMYKTLVYRLSKIHREKKLSVEALPKYKGPNKFDVPHYMLTNHFVGRETILNEIYECFSADGTQVHVLHGNGGMGKTQIALKHAQEYSSMYDTVVWIQADSDERMQDSFRCIAVKMGLDCTLENTASYVLSKFSEAGGKVLLIYDNLDDGDLKRVIEKYHKPKWKDAIRVLITTRNREYLALRTQASIVEPLGADDAAQLLRGLVSHDHDMDPDSDSNVSELCRALGNFPLGILQAAAYITTSGISYSHYLDVLNKEPQYALGYEAQMFPYKKTVFTVWEASLARVEETSQYSARWFFLCSFLDTTVAHNLFELACSFCQRTRKDHQKGARRYIEWLYPSNTKTTWTAATLQSSLLKLQSLSLISTSYQRGQEACTTYHPLVQQWARLRLPKRKQEEFLVMAVSLIYACAEELCEQENVRRDTRTAYYVQRQLISHAHSCVRYCDDVLKRNIAKLVPVECTITLATFYIYAKEYGPANEMLEVAIQRPDEDPIDIVAAQRVLAWALRWQNKPGEALSLQTLAIEGLTSLEPLAQPGERIRAFAELASIYRDINNLEKAVELQSQVVDDAKAEFGPDASDTLLEMSCLATIHNKMKEYEKACRIDEYVLAIYKKKQRNSSEILNKMKNLGITYYNLKRYNEGVLLEKAVLEEMEKLYGRDHPGTASAMHYLAATYKAMGCLHQALPLFSEALAIRKAALGENHEGTKKSAKFEKETRRLLERAPAAERPQERPQERPSKGLRVDSGIDMDWDAEV